MKTVLYVKIFEVQRYLGEMKLKKLLCELSLPFRPCAKHTPQAPSNDTTSDKSLQTLSSSSNVLVATHKFANQPPTLNPLHPPVSHQPITTHPSTSFYFL